MTQVPGDDGKAWGLIEQAANGAVLRAHLQPGAKRSGVSGTYGDALKISVQARAVDGRANEALLALLATELSVPRDRLSLVSGRRSRDKRVLFEAVGANELARSLSHIIDRGSD